MPPGMVAAARFLCAGLAGGMGRAGRQGQACARWAATSRGALYAYWIEAGPGDSRLYFVVDGEETVYALVGAVTPDVYRSVLADMRFSPPP